MSRRNAHAAALAVLVLLTGAPAAAQEASPVSVPVQVGTSADAGKRDAGTARITYLTSITAYVDVGVSDGLAAGARLEVVRDGQVVAVLTCTDIATHRAACKSSTPTTELKVGDVVRYKPGTAPSAAAKQDGAQDGAGDGRAPAAAAAEPAAPTELSQQTLAFLHPAESFIAGGAQ